MILHRTRPRSRKKFTYIQRHTLADNGNKQRETKGDRTPPHDDYEDYRYHDNNNTYTSRSKSKG